MEVGFGAFTDVLNAPARKEAADGGQACKHWEGTDGILDEPDGRLDAVKLPLDEDVVQETERQVDLHVSTKKSLGGPPQPTSEGDARRPWRANGKHAVDVSRRDESLAVNVEVWMLLNFARVSLCIQVALQCAFHACHQCIPL